MVDSLRLPACSLIGPQCEVVPRVHGAETLEGSNDNQCRCRETGPTIGPDERPSRRYDGRILKEKRPETGPLIVENQRDREQSARRGPVRGLATTARIWLTRSKEEKHQRDVQQRCHVQ